MPTGDRYQPAIRSQFGAFRAWRRRRPFTGGLLLLLAGLELLAIPLSGVLSHGALRLVVYIGIGGVFGVLIGALLITAGIALWVHPVHRAFYGVAGVVLGIVSFLASNLGGFFLCMLLAIIGGSLAFAWTPMEPEVTPSPDREPAPPPAAEPAGAEPSRAVAPSRAAPPDHAGPPEHRWLALALPLLVASGLAVTHPGTASGPAARSQPSQTCILGLICLPGGGPSSPPPAPSPSSPAPTCLPTALPTTLPTALPTSLPECLPTALPTSLPTPSLPVSVPAGAGVPGASAPASPGTGGGPSHSPKARTSTAGAGLVVPTAVSVITAGSATLDHFAYRGNVKMPSAGGGTVTMMKFTATSLTLSAGAADTVTESGVTAVTSSPVMAFRGNVVLYATKLSGTLAGIPLTFTPATISGLLLTTASVLTASTEVTMTSVTTDQAMGTADSLTYGPAGDGFSVTLH